MRTLVPAAALVLLTGCAWAIKTQGADGKEVFRVHCATPAACAEKAAEVCAGGYRVVSSRTTADGYAENGTGYADHPHETLVACAGAEAAPSPPASRPPPSAPPPTSPGDCGAAYGSVKETAAFWAGLAPDAKRLPELPSQADFVEVCRALPDRVQRCLDARYREAHEHKKACLAVLRRLETGEKNKVDSLFLE
jgi:hypothetical protein